MPEPCMFNILELPEDALRKALPKASARSLARLASAYPRAVGRTFMTLLTQCMSAPTVQFLREEMIAQPLPSFIEIREAESELMRIIHEEQPVPPQAHN